MKPLLRSDGPPSDNVLVFADVKVTTRQENLPTSSALGLGKKCSVALVAIVATFGWLYLIAKTTGAFLR